MPNQITRSRIERRPRSRSRRLTVITPETYNLFPMHEHARAHGVLAAASGQMIVCTLVCANRPPENWFCNAKRNC